MPERLARGYVGFYDRFVKDSAYPHDDGAIRTYAWLENAQVMSTVPALVNNLCPMDSVIDKSHNDANAASHTWEGRQVSGCGWDKGLYSEKYYPTYLELPQFAEIIKRKRRLRKGL